VIDNDIGSKTIHAEIDNKFIMISDNFLEIDFKDKKYDLIFMNPPWKTFGIKFIDKAISLLKEGGKLVCIMGYAGFTPVSNKITKGSFRDLLHRGYFERIENHSGADFGINYCPFKNRGNDLWFIFVKDTENPQTKRNNDTIIVNRLKEEFSTKLDIGMKYIPQIENEKDYFDYKGGISVVGVDRGKITKHDTFGVRSHSAEYNITKYNKNETIDVSQIVVYDKNHEIDEDKLYTFFNQFENKYLYKLYSHTGGYLRIPPIKRELILKDEYL